MKITKEELEKYESILKSGLTNLKLDIEFPYQEMYEEIEPFLDDFVVHRSDYSNGGWKSLVLHGQGTYATTSTESKEYHEHNGELGWTKMANACNVTYNFFKNIWPVKRHKRIRWMLLEPGGIIYSHQDSTDCMLGDAVNFSLNHPEECDFILGNKVVPWKPGEARLLNLSNYHRIENKSNERRVHMIYHGFDIRCNRTSEWSKKNQPFTFAETCEQVPDYVRTVIRSYSKEGHS
tara:strand:+ start:2336 stop:3040 length:705 start_codon:yes stop_codon:yes gene_type:complete